MSMPSYTQKQSGSAPCGISNCLILACVQDAAAGYVGSSFCVQPPSIVLDITVCLLLCMLLVFPPILIVRCHSMRTPCMMCPLMVPTDQPARLQELYPNGSQADIHFEEYFPYPIWKDEKMHALLLDAALSAADAIATSGKPVRTGKHVMLRMDLISMTSNSKVLPPYTIHSCHDCAATCCIESSFRSGSDHCGTFYG